VSSYLTISPLPERFEAGVPAVYFLLRSMRRRSYAICAGSPPVTIATERLSVGLAILKALAHTPTSLLPVAVSDYHWHPDSRREGCSDFPLPRLRATAITQTPAA